MNITNATTISKVLATLSATRWATPGTVAKAVGISKWAAESLLHELWLDEVVDSKPHDCTRMTYRLAA